MKTAVKVLFFLSRCCFYLFSLINEKFGSFHTHKTPSGYFWILDELIIHEKNQSSNL